MFHSWSLIMGGFDETKCKRAFNLKWIKKCQLNEVVSTLIRFYKWKWFLVSMCNSKTEKFHLLDLLSVCSAREMSLLQQKNCYSAALRLLSPLHRWRVRLIKQKPLLLCNWLHCLPTAVSITIIGSYGKAKHLCALQCLSKQKHSNWIFSEQNQNVSSR